MKLFPPIKPTVLVVDDAPSNLALISAILKFDYTVKAANHGQKALDLCAQEPPDLILLDIVMPDIDGYEVCRRLKVQSETQPVPIIFLTSKSDVEDEEMGLQLGAVDYITRPINPRILQSRVRAHIADTWRMRTLHKSNEHLEFEISRRTQEVLALQNVTTLALASLAETRDTDTGNHLLRTQHYVLAMARALKVHPKFAHYLTESRIQALFKSAPLHDIGKVGIPDRVLLKRGKFEPDEWRVMQQHPTLGYEALERAKVEGSSNSDFLEIAKEIVLSHHEKWDGTGYPQGLAAERIPMAARLMAVADVYDALISRRIYKEPAPHAQAVQIILQGRGTHFDPDVVDAFERIAHEFADIAQQFADSDDDLLHKAHALGLRG